MKYLFKRKPLVVFTLLLSVYACQNDDTDQNNEQTPSQDVNFVIQMESGDHLQTMNPKMYQKLVQRSSTAKNSENNASYSLDLQTIQIIERNTYTQYTTAVLGHNEQVTSLINYVFIEFDDGATYQFLIKYPRIVLGEDETIDHANAVMEVIDGEIVFNKSGIGQPRPCLDGVPEIIESVQQYICVYTKCSGNLNHTWGEECPCEFTLGCIRATRTCGWETVNVWGCSGGGVVSGNGNDGTAGGGSNDPNDTNQDDPVVTVPIFDVRDANIKNKLLEYSNTTLIKNKLADLGQKIFNPNYHLEDGAMYKRLANGQYTNRPPDVITELGTEFIPEFKIGEVVSLHIHALKAWDYSGDVPVLKEVSPIFSKIDVHKFLKFRKFREDTEENIPGNNDDDIVAILASKTGIYALAIGDEEKMSEALTALGNDPEYHPTQNWNSFRDRFNDKVLDNCNGDDDCIIKAFVEFLKDKHKELGNQTLGIRLYEAVINNGEITRWKRL
ncbi:hypothetical protein KORDIASMS9_04540 [Kordia sp. SMS9]|uniref:hypothetical protein n=1 Tax=Kordia sp. SMS9 TaxID=2282170 RepID=UPI000E0D2B02|nr:hypothetical protein [Kordia sp. SMS9]AXG72271.1 hypothetical protein KORDIASMS9_04540 [Kordia sp. SMS9]